MKTTQLHKPIFIVGTGRCGSTILHQMFAYQHQLAWLSWTCHSYPHRPQYNQVAMRLFDTPLPKQYLFKLLHPSEAYNLWDMYSPGFSEPYRDLYKEDVTPVVQNRLLKVLTGMLTRQRTRLMVKITGWPRIGFLKELFPDAKFIHVYRDGRAVVNSLLNVPWWSGWHGPQRWRWGRLTAEQQAKWQQFDESFVALAAIEWEILMTAQEEAKQRLAAAGQGADLLEIRYEAFCQDPLGTFKQVIDFCDLEWTADFEATINRFNIKSSDYKWQSQLTKHQQAILNDCLSDSLAKYGYS